MTDVISMIHLYIIIYKHIITCIIAFKDFIDMHQADSESTHIALFLSVQYLI